MAGPRRLTAEERAELDGLRKRKAWRSPRYRELDRVAHEYAVWAWRQEDIWGVIVADGEEVGRA